MTGTLALPTVDHKLESTDNEKSKDALDVILHSHHVEHSLLWDMAKFVHVAPEDKDKAIHIVHSAHLLASLHYLGATPARLREVYASESQILLPRPAPSDGTTTPPISADDWRAFLGRRDRAREYLDFFEGELARLGGDWRALAARYLLPSDGGGPNAAAPPLVESLTGDLCHPLIHLAYAYELRSGELAADALAYCAVHYQPETPGYLDARSSSSSSSPTAAAAAAAASSPLEVLENVRRDARLDGFPSPGPGREHFGAVFAQHEDVILHHWRSWPPPGAPLTTEHFRQAFDASVALVVGSSSSPDGDAYDFILLHVLTSCHALRVLLPEFPEEYQAVLFNQWWLFTLMVYITQLRPAIDDALISDYALEGRDWSYPIKRATESSAGFDAHYVKTIRAIQVAGDVGALFGGQSPEWYLKAAVRFAEGFRHYKGFGPVDDDMINQLMALSGQGSSQRHQD